MGNIALHSYATMSGEFPGGYPAIQSVDGDMDTFAHTWTMTGWWRVDFDQPYPVHHINVYSRIGFLDRFTTFGILNGSNAAIQKKYYCEALFDKLKISFYIMVKILSAH